MTTKQYNDIETISAINNELEKIGVPYFAKRGKRAIQWFKNYEFNGGGYSIGINIVRNALYFNESGNLDEIMERSHLSIFTEADRV